MSRYYSINLVPAVRPRRNAKRVPWIKTTIAFQFDRLDVDAIAGKMIRLKNYQQPTLACFEITIFLFRAEHTAAEAASHTTVGEIRYDPDRGGKPEELETGRFDIVKASVVNSSVYAYFIY